MNPVFEFYINPENPRHGIFPDVPNEQYHATPGFSPSLVKKSMNDYRSGFGGARGHISRIPADLHAQQEIAAGHAPPPGYERQENKAFKIGSLYHLLLLEPDKFDRKYARLTEEIMGEQERLAEVRKMEKAPKEFSYRLGAAREEKKRLGRDLTPPEQEALMEKVREEFRGSIKWHSKLTEYTEWKEEQEAQGKEVITASELSTTQGMVDAIHNHPLNAQVGAVLALERTEGKALIEASLYAKMEFANGVTVQLRGRPDMLTGPSSDAILDPKSCGSCYPWDFAKDVHFRHYALQAGAYILLTELLSDTDEGKAMGFPKKNFGFIAQEKTPPFLCKLFWMPPDWLNYGKHLYITAIRKIVHAAETDDWSGTGDEFQFPDWDETGEMPGEMLMPPDNIDAILAQF